MSEAKDIKNQANSSVSERSDRLKKLEELYKKLFELN